MRGVTWRGVASRGVASRRATRWRGVAVVGAVAVAVAVAVIGSAWHRFMRACCAMHLCVARRGATRCGAAVRVRERVRARGRAHRLAHRARCSRSTALLLSGEATYRQDDGCLPAVALHDTTLVAMYSLKRVNCPWTLSPRPDWDRLGRNRLFKIGYKWDLKLAPKLASKMAVKLARKLALGGSQL